MSNFILEMKGISKEFPGIKALDKVDFFVKKGSVHCLIGANGAGKSTLIKILSGAYKHDTGEIIFDGNKLNDENVKTRRRLGISVIYQELSLINDLSIAENIYINSQPKNKFKIIDWKKMVNEAQKIIEGLHLKINVTTNVSKLSTGQRQMVELAKSIISNAKLIVMDEPSATLSTEEYKTLIKVIKDLKNKGITIIYISHRLEELFEVGDVITVLRDGKHIITKEVPDINMEMLVEYMIGKKLDKEQGKNKSTNNSSDTILELKNVTTDKVKDISFKVHKGEILGLYGLVGSGRTEILKAIYGVDKIISGEVVYKSKPIKNMSPSKSVNNAMGLLPENRKYQGLALDLSIYQNISSVSLNKFTNMGILNYKNIFSSCINFSKKLMIKAPSIHTITKNLSGGNQQKVIFAKWLMKNCDLFLIDEPTQGIDIGAKYEIYSLMKSITESGRSIIIVSSEIDELIKVCDRVLVVYYGQIIGKFDDPVNQQNTILEYSITGGKHDKNK